MLNYNRGFSKLNADLNKFNEEFTKFNQDFTKCHAHLANLDRRLSAVNRGLAAAERILANKNASEGGKNAAEIGIYQFKNSKKEVESEKTTVEKRKAALETQKAELAKKKQAIDSKKSAIEELGKKLDRVVVDIPADPKSWNKQHFQKLATKEFGFDTFEAFVHLVKLTEPTNKSYGGTENKKKAEAILDTYLPKGLTRNSFIQMIKNVAGENYEDRKAVLDARKPN